MECRAKARGEELTDETRTRIFMKHDEVISKVRRMLNTNGRTPEEAAQFAAKAQELIDRHRLNVADLEYGANEKEREDEPIKNYGYEDPIDNVKAGGYRETWTQRLASIVGEHNGCRCFWSRNNGRTMRDGITIRIVGKPSDVEATRYLYSFFKRQIEELQKVECKGNSTVYRGEFAAGCIDTLSTRLGESRAATFAAARQENAGNAMALVRVDKAIERLKNPLAEVNQWIDDQSDKRMANAYGVTLAEYRADPVLCAAKSRGMDKDEYAKWLRKQRRFSSGSRGIDGAGARRSTGGREHGQKAGANIRMTGGRKEIQ